VDTESYAACDPGVGGGFAVKMGGCITSFAMPKTIHDIRTVFFDMKAGGVKTLILEKVTGFNTNPHAPQLASKMGVMMRNVGHVEMAAACHGMRIEEVRAQVWQPALGMFKKPGEERDKWKNRLKDLAQRLYPDHNVTKATADAYLLLEFHTRAKKSLSHS
jgi:hypothetical protein